MPHQLKFTVAYEGTAYLGWQNTPFGPTIEEALQKVLEKILQAPIQLEAASRTDAGVHALGQVVTCHVERLPPSLHRLCLSANQLLPRDIVVTSAEEMPLSFHPTLSAQKKMYHYSLCYGFFQLPWKRRWSWHCPYPLDLEAVQRGAAAFVGKHDFASMGNTRKHSCYTHTEREIFRLEILPLPENSLRFEIEGNHFLYKMVRNIVGTLVQIGRGKRLAEEIPALLASRDRKQAGMTAPPHGLLLYQVDYRKMRIT